MLWTLAIILALLWMLGLVTSYTAQTAEAIEEANVQGWQ